MALMLSVSRNASRTALSASTKMLEAYSRRVERTIRSNSASSAPPPSTQSSSVSTEAVAEVAAPQAEVVSRTCSVSGFGRSICALSHTLGPGESCCQSSEKLGLAASRRSVDSATVCVLPTDGVHNDSVGPGCACVRMSHDPRDICFLCSGTASLSGGVGAGADLPSRQRSRPSSAVRQPSPSIRSKQCRKKEL